MSVVNLDSIILRQEPGQYESLALALRAVIEAAGGEADYDPLCAALGVSFAAVAVRVEPAPGWWMTCGRDAFLAEAASLFGLRLRDLHPADVGIEMAGADEFPQHFDASYLPLIQRALTNGQPVLTWRGWPGVSEPFWGVLTGSTAQGLTGVVMWSQGPQPLERPALQAYVVEDCTPVLPPRDRLFHLAMQHAHAYMNLAPFAPVLPGMGEPALVTGPAAFDAWERWLDPAQDLIRTADEPWREHRQHAEFIVTSRQSAGRFLGDMLEMLPAEQRSCATEAQQECQAVVEHLSPSCDESFVRECFTGRSGIERLLAAVHAAEAADRRLAMQVEQLASAS